MDMSSHEISAVQKGNSKALEETQSKFGKDNLTWKACDHRGRRRFVSVKTKQGNLVANVGQYAMLRERQDAGVPTTRDAFATNVVHQRTH